MMLSIEVISIIFTSLGEFRDKTILGAVVKMGMTDAIPHIISVYYVHANCA